jgi:lipopolysaccharide/colanic/teichoic acid biosynthesis glycosyltransferase
MANDLLVGVPKLDLRMTRCIAAAMVVATLPIFLVLAIVLRFPRTAPVIIVHEVSNSHGKKFRFLRFRVPVRNGKLTKIGSFMNNTHL